MSDRTIIVKESVLREIVDQLCMCNFECEAGHIEKNVAFRMLNRIANNVYESEPIWELAPEWAEWWACDQSGDAYWYAEKPHLSTSNKFWLSSGGENDLAKRMGEEAPDWKESLRRKGERSE